MNDYYIEFDTAEQWADASLEDLCSAQDLARDVTDYGSERIVKCEYLMQQAIEKMLKAEIMYETGSLERNYKTHMIDVLLSGITNIEYINNIPAFIVNYPDTISEWAINTRYFQNPPVCSILDLFSILEDLEIWIRSTMQKYWT